MSDTNNQPNPTDSDNNTNSNSSTIPNSTPNPTSTPNPNPNQTPNPTPNPNQTPNPTPNPNQTPNPTPNPTSTPNPTPNPTTTPTTNQFTIIQLDQIIRENGIEITNNQGKLADGSEITHTTFNTTDPDKYDPQIKEDLAETVKISETDTTNPENAELLNEIKTYASKITCSDFHGKGSIDDYTELFKAAANIANESKQMKLDIDVDGFDDFGKAADELSDLFANYIIRLQNVNIINDSDFLRSIASSLKKIWNLSEVFGRFKQTILTTSTIQIPKSAHETKIVLEGVMSELNCAMKYIEHFVNPTNIIPIDAELSTDEKNIIEKAVITIDNWNILAEQGVSIAMSSNPDIQFIKDSNNQIKNKTILIKSATDRLKAKLSLYKVSN